MTHTLYIYTYRWTEEERSLCKLEQRSFFNTDTESTILESNVCLDPSRSPFIRGRIDVMFEGETIDSFLEDVSEINVTDGTYKVICLKNEDEPDRIPFKERLRLAQMVGERIGGEADLKKPDVEFALLYVNGRWVFGRHHKNKAVWLHHQKKPHSFSTSLGTRLARALVNIAVPDPTGKKVIDPCCGIGTVLVEACSMGIDIVGSDINWLVIPGARENVAHFGYDCHITHQAIEDIDEQYDVAIIDMPYNIICATTPEEERSIVENARRIAKRVVFVATDMKDEVVEEAGFTIIDRCIARKSSFKRKVLVCK